jgi:hypothetical protein
MVPSVKSSDRSREHAKERELMYKYLSSAVDSFFWETQARAVPLIPSSREHVAG